MADQDSQEDARASFEDLREDLQLIIAALREKIGRMPTQDEVLAFLFADTDEEREHILAEIKG